MKIGEYSFVNPVSFRGHEGYGFECDIKKGGKKFGFYHDSGDGGCGYLSQNWDGSEKERKTCSLMLKNFEDYALGICPPYPASLELNVPEHSGDIDFFFCYVSAWIEMEKIIKKLKRNYRNKNSVVVFLDEESFPLSAAAMAFPESMDITERENSLISAYRQKKIKLNQQEKRFVIFDYQDIQTSLSFMEFPKGRLLAE